MRFVLPRTIKANRGDLASRWALLNTLSDMGFTDNVVFAHTKDDVPDHVKNVLPYGYLHNVFPSLQGWKNLLKSDIVIWGVGLDMQDDSSLMKLMYLFVIFRIYRILGLEIWMLFQGAGPLDTRVGQYLAKGILKCAKVFVARDRETLALVESLTTKPKFHLGHDAIFLPELEKDLKSFSLQENDMLDQWVGCNDFLVGFNIRQWFHFSSSLLPYKFSKERYKTRSESKMQELIGAVNSTLRFLRAKYNAKILLISAYQPKIEPWEDDLQWLQIIKKDFIADDDVVLVDSYLSMPAYYQLMSRLNLIVGMRLHTTLVALRFGVPAINLSYTLKGESILSHLGLSNLALDLNTYIKNPDCLNEKISLITDDLDNVRKDISCSVTSSVQANARILQQLLSNISSSEI